MPSRHSKPPRIRGLRHESQRARKAEEKELRKTLLKYKLHTDQELFDRAYAYIKQYY